MADFIPLSAKDAKKLFDEAKARIIETTRDIIFKNIQDSANKGLLCCTLDNRYVDYEIKQELINLGYQVEVSYDRLIIEWHSVEP